MKFKNQNLIAQELQSAILGLLRTHAKKQYTPKQIKEKLRVENTRDNIEEAIDHLLSKNLIISYKDVKYGALLGDEGMRSTSEKPVFKMESFLRLYTKNLFLWLGIRISITNA